MSSKLINILEGFNRQNHLPLGFLIVGHIASFKNPKLLGLLLAQEKARIPFELRKIGLLVN